MRLTTKEKAGILAVRGVTDSDKRSLLRIAKKEGMLTLSALLRREIKRLIRSHRKAA